MKKRIKIDRAGSLNEKQKSIFRAVSEGKNVFYTGCAGSGKSLLLKEMYLAESAKRGKGRVYVVAPTGTAAENVAGTTIHSFAGIGHGNDPYETLLRKVLTFKSAANRWRKTSLLFIDEISMLDRELFEKLDKIARTIRCRPAEPFGGIQIVASGDFYQLAPVNNRYVFESPLWSKTMRETFVLTEVYRQKDRTLLDGLNQMRVGVLTEEFSRIFREKEISARADGLVPTKLVAKNDEVDRINTEELNKLPGSKRTYYAEDREHVPGTLSRYLSVPEKVTLTEGAQVVCLKNMPELGLVNGSRGVVESFLRVADEFRPVVRFSDGTVAMTAVPFDVTRNGEIVGTRKALPLKLAWALSIHKSQGLSLDLVHVDLRGTFAAGQAYVALSRARTLEGLSVVGLSEDRIFCDERVVNFYEQITY